MSVRSRHFSSFPLTGDPTDSVVLPEAEFDELVVGRWLHIEQVSESTWWMNVAGVTLFVTADRDGRPQRVTLYPPDTYDDAVTGCEYNLAEPKVADDA